LKGGENVTNKKAFDQSIKKGYQKQPKHPPTLGTPMCGEPFHLKWPVKRKRRRK
jgi:hypothetical protein